MTDLRDRLQSSLGTTYTIERELGGGGMSRVFLATERRFDRSVVLKVLPPDVTGAISAERFEREIQHAAKLQHPHIVPLLTAGQTDDVLYYTMPYVRGETLRDRLAREGRLPASEALRITMEVADALASAHRAGVVHRDIKPENILLSDGHAVVADFGISKAISASTTYATEQRGDTGLTQLGTALGTPAYMSPEQSAGETNLDGRSDIYSLGCVLYEMLSGRQPFTGPSAAAVIAKRFSEAPTPLRTLDNMLSADVEQTVVRAMAREPSQRFATAQQMLDALKVLVREPERAREAAENKASVAVLPFTNMSGNPDDEYFSDGLTEEAINALAHLPGIRVAARTSSFVFKGQRVDLRSIAEQLKVATVLEGSVRRAGTRVRISVQLVSASDGLHLWSERYDRELSDIFALQDEIARAIADALRQQLGAAAAIPTPPDATVHRAVDPAAHDLYLRGRFLFERVAALEAMKCFEQATQIDPDFALAHAWFGLSHTLAANFHAMRALTAYPLGREAALRALELDPRCVEAHIAMTAYTLWFEWDARRGEELARHAVTIGPSWANCHEFVAWAVLLSGRIDEALEAAERSRSLDPLSEFMLLNFSMIHVYAGREARAIELLAATIERSPADARMQYCMGRALYSAHRLPEARAALERAAALEPLSNWVASHLATVYAAVGEPGKAREQVNEARRLHDAGLGAAAEVAFAYHALGDEDAAFEWLERAFLAREHWMAYLHLEPRVRDLHGTHRFDVLLKRIGVATVSTQGD